MRSSSPGPAHSSSPCDNRPSARPYLGLGGWGGLRAGLEKAEGGAGSAHLARGGHREVEAVDGDADRNAHAREAQVALAQD